MLYYGYTGRRQRDLTRWRYERELGLMRTPGTCALHRAMVISHDGHVRAILASQVIHFGPLPLYC
jgi:hypothetical protein